MSILKTPVSILQELLQKSNKIPQYILLPSEGLGTHNPTFRFHVNADNVIGYGKARSKKDAKHEAAKDALAKFTELGKYIPEQSSSTPPIQTSPNKHQETDTPCYQINAVGMLKDLVAEHNLPPPEFNEISDVGPAHQRLFTLQCTVGTLKKTATEYTKKKAKQSCAQLMYNCLLESLPDIADDDIQEFLSVDDDAPLFSDILTELIDNSVIYNKKKENYKLKIAEYPQTFNKIMKEKRMSYTELWEDINTTTETGLEMILNRLDLKYTIDSFDNDSNIIVILTIDSEPNFSVAEIVDKKDDAVPILLTETFEFLKILSKE